MSQENTARLNIEFRSINVNRAVADADAVKQRVSSMFRETFKSAKDSAAVFEEDQRQMHAAWLRRLKEREQAEKVQQRQAGLSARAEIEKTRAMERQLEAEKRASYKLGVATQLVQIRAAAAEAVAIKKAAIAQEKAADRERRKQEQADAKAALVAIRAQEKAALAEKRAQERAAAAERRTADRAAAAESRALARQQAARDTNANRGFRVGIGAVAGQGFSVGGIASVNPMAAGAVAAAYMVKNATQDLVREATKWEKFKVALTDIEGSAMKADVALNNLYQIAKQPGIGLLQAQQTYVQYRALNVEGAKAEKTIKAIANAVALSGGGATEFERVNYQIVQMLSKGKVLEEDLRIMRNSMPRLTVAMREAFGETTAEGIRKAGVNAEDFLAGIITQFEKLPKASQTLESAQENAATAMSKLKASLINTDYVKEKLAGWTGLLESMTKIVEGESVKWGELFKSAFTQGPGAAINDFAAGTFSQTPEQVRAMEMYEKTLQLQKLRQGGDAKQFARNDKGELYSISLQDKIEMLREELEAYGREMRMAQVNKFIAGLPSLKTEGPAAEVKASASILLENQKLAIALSNANEYEKQRRTLAAEYAYKIGEAGNEEDKIALAKQRGLQIALINKKQREEEQKTLEAVALQYDKLAIQAMRVSDYEKQRLQLGVDYEVKMRETTSSAVKISLAEQKRMELQALKTKYAQEEAVALEAINAETDKLLIDNLQINEFARQRLLIQAEYEGRRAGATPEQKRALNVQEEIALAGVDAKEKEAGEQLLLKYLPETERLRIEHEKQAAMIKTMTKLTMDERNLIVNKANEEYLAKQRELTVKSSEVFLTGTSSLFDALSGTAEGVMGKQSEAYKAMFVTSKAFAIANASLQVANAIANAAGGLPFPANLAAMGQVAAATAGLVSNINALSFSGVFDKGGYIPQGSFGIAGENGPEFVRGPAYVTSTANTAKAMQSSQSSEMKVTVNNFSSESVATRKGNDGSLEIIIGKAVAAAEERIASGIATGSGRVARSMEATYGVRR